MTITTEQPTLPEPEGESKQALASLWWMPLIRGILLILFAIFMFVQPGATLLGLIWVLGIYWLVDGVFDLIEGIRGHTDKSRTWMIIGGILGILAGIFILGRPVLAGIVGGTFLVYLIGITTIIAGVMMIFAGRDGHWTWSGLLMGILYVIFGLVIVANPLMSLGALIWLIPIWAIVSGICAIALAVMLRSVTNEAISG